jgi:7,8-dihydroneopterin aldolase/epimerase/oxygenase
MTIHLHNLSFFAHHGVHEEEKILGGNFIVNADISFADKSDTITRLPDTVDYVQAYSKIKELMSSPTPLLETLAMQIVDQLYSKYPFVSFISVNIMKLNAPITGLQGSVGVTFSRSFV